MANELRKYYFVLITPAAIILISVYLFRLYGMDVRLNSPTERTTNVLLFVLSAAFGIAFPILCRTWFVKKIESRKTLEPDEFLRFEKRILLIALTVPYFAVVAVFFNLPFQYLAGIFLIAIYSVYFFYPSDKRIEFDKKIFRVRL